VAGGSYRACPKAAQFSIPGRKRLCLDSLSHIGSRQAAFAGKAPIFFPNSIWTTDKEPTLWSQFWADQGFTTNEVVYIKGLGDGGLETVSEALSHPMARIVDLS